MIDGPSVPGAGEFRYQPGLESGSSKDGTSTDPSGFKPSWINGELMPMAGIDRVIGGGAGSTGPTGVGPRAGTGAAAAGAAGTGSLDGAALGGADSLADGTGLCAAAGCS